MTNFQFNPVTPHPHLRPYVAKMWIFESSGKLPVQDMKLIVPNTNFKLTLTSKNGMVAQIDGKTFVQQENQLSLSGFIDAPVMLDPLEDAPTGTIVIELNPLGAYRLFRISYAEARNRIVVLPDLLGKQAAELQARLADAPALAMKLHLLQQFLLRQLKNNTPDVIYDYCINRITGARGLITVGQLEKATGYSARWLNRKFIAHLGTSPGNLSGIVRFKQYYQAFSSGADPHSLKEHIYEYYHDQSHFIRAFKRFTGHTPTYLLNSMNELATRHYTG